MSDVNWSRVLGVSGLVLACWCLVSLLVAIWWGWWVRHGRRPPS